MNDTERSRLDPLIDLLADEVARRLAAKTQVKPVESQPAPPAPPPPVAPPPVKAAAAPPEAEPAREPAPGPISSAPISNSSHAAPLMARLAVGIFAVVILINLPLNAQGTAIARSIPNSASLVIMNGLVVKEQNSPDIYVYRDNAFHWITSLDAFSHYGYRWQQVQIVEPGFLNAFPKGKPIYVLLKCDSSPHIYQLEAGQKRWIVDIRTFEAQGYVWQDVKFVPCSYLRDLPDGESIPPGYGTPTSQLP